MIGSARNGLLVIIIIIAAVYYSGAGSWALNSMKGLDSACYSGLGRLGAQAANPVCAALAKGLSAVDDFANTVDARIERWRYGLFGSDGIDKLSNMASSFGNRVSGLSSSGDDLARMISNGPSGFASAGQQSFQQAIDYFAIGQGYLNGGASSQALPWLQQGARQPEGFGLMSQLTLGNLYANGGQGVTPNSQRAEYYLNQAQQSIAVLSANNSPQSQQLLKTLPQSPQKIQADLERAILQIRAIRP